MKKSLLIFTLIFAVYCINNISAQQISQEKIEKIKKLEKLNIEQIYSTKRTGEMTDFLLYKSQKRDTKTLKNVIAELKKISSKFYLYDDINVLEYNWLNWGAAFEPKEYYIKIDKLGKFSFHPFWSIRICL